MKEMNTNMQRLKNAVLPSAPIREVENEHNIHLTLEDEKELDIDYHRTINAICNLIREAGWNSKVYFSKTSNTSFILKRNE